MLGESCTMPFVSRSQSQNETRRTRVDAVSRITKADRGLGFELLVDPSSAILRNSEFEALAWLLNQRNPVKGDKDVHMIVTPSTCDNNSDEESQRSVDELVDM